MAYGRIFFVYKNGKTVITVPEIVSQAALVAYAKQLQELSCAQIIQVEFIEIIDIDTPESDGEYAEILFRANISLRDEDTQEPLTVLFPSPKDQVFEMLDRRFQIVPPAIGNKIVQAYHNATGKNVEFVRGKLCRLTP